MLTQMIWWSGVVLAFLVLLRGMRVGMFYRFPYFYAYLSFVFLQSLALLAIFHRYPTLYGNAYWYCEFASLLLGSLVIFEIYRVALRPYPGTARIARNLLFFVFALTFAKVLVNQSLGSVYWPATTTAELERNLRIVQACAILAVGVVMLIYAIPRNRNLKGILAGYGLFVACSVIQLSLLSYLGSSFNLLWSYIYPFSYLVVLCIWTATLWSPATEPVSPRAALHLGVEDHSSLIARSKQDLQGVDLGVPGAFRR